MQVASQPLRSSWLRLVPGHCNEKRIYATKMQLDDAVGPPAFPGNNIEDSYSHTLRKEASCLRHLYLDRASHIPCMQKWTAMISSFGYWIHAGSQLHPVFKDLKANYELWSSNFQSSERQMPSWTHKPSMLTHKWARKMRFISIMQCNQPLTLRIRDCQLE